MSTGYTKKKCHILFFKLIWWHFKKLQREHYLCPCMLKLAGTPRLHCNNMINIFHVYRRNLFQMCPILKKNGILYFPDNLILKANSCFEYKNTFNEKKRLCTTMGGSHAPKKKLGNSIFGWGRVFGQIFVIHLHIFSSWSQYHHLLPLVKGLLKNISFVH